MLIRYTQYGWSKKSICHKWGISTRVFCETNLHVSIPGKHQRIQLNKITAEEKQKVIEYALKHTELNHREMAYRMIDEDVAYMSPSSVYRILRGINLLHRRKHKAKPDKWDPHATLSGPEQIWQTDLMYIHYRGRDYYLLTYLDIFSRFAVYHELCLSMTGDSIREATIRALEVTGRTPQVIQSDNGSCYISTEYRSIFKNSETSHIRIHPHCPNENAEIERYHRTLRERIDPQDADNFESLRELVNEQINYYNYIRYHSALGFVTPHDKYSGKAEKIINSRKIKLSRAKQERMKFNCNRIQEKQRKLIKKAA